MLVRQPKILMQHAWENGYAVPAFNVCNAELVRAIVEAAEFENAPVILQTYSGDIKYGGIEVLGVLLRHFGERATIPVLMHLDHPESLGMTLACLKQDFYSVMFDGGHLGLEDNLRETARIAELAHSIGAIVEGELGQFGGEHQGMRLEETRPADTRRMFEDGQVDMLAVSIGSVHGQKSRLDLVLLEEISKSAKGPLVLHGGSGIDSEDLSQAIKMGVAKVNIGAAIFDAWLRGLQEGLALDIPHYPRHYEVMRHAIRSVRCEARKRIAMLGASGRAAEVHDLLAAKRPLTTGQSLP
jgi:fructose-bisphosphate aldolase class II